MARMFPKIGPQNTGSHKAEPDIYWRLSKQLSDEFTVIHSLPWLASAAREIDNRFVPTGEIDFLILHQELGILAIEVKGGILIHDRTEFVYKKTGDRVDPVGQVRRGVHALARWLNQSGSGSWRIGYCVIFPNSEMRGSIPIPLIDHTVNPSRRIVLDITSLNTLGEEIQEIMEYWKKALNTWSIKNHQIEKLVNILLPSEDYTPCWQTRINNDNITWLRLTKEQSDCLRRIEKSERLVVTGFPGTGKTLLLIEYARRSAALGKEVLVLTYNFLLAKRLQAEISSSMVDVLTFHEQCRRADNIINRSASDSEGVSNPRDGDWYSFDGPIALQIAVIYGNLKTYDILVVDEGQALHIDWWATLCQWFTGKQIIAFCDSTQSFSFENSTSPQEIAHTIHAKSPFILTISLRSPRAILNRVLEVKSPEYQLSCPRPLEEDVLLEVTAGSPECTFNEIIRSLLYEEKIPKQSIVIIDIRHGKKKGNYLGIPIFSAAKFRGMESPVVVIYAEHSSDETALFCAYTRATSRCIVIYDAVSVLRGGYGSFGQILLEEKTEKAIRREASSRLTSGILDEQNFRLKPLNTQTISLSWCHDWHSWIVYPTNSNNIARSMWTYHLISTTKQPVYTWNLDSEGELTYFEPVENLNKRSGIECVLSFCEKCELLTPHKKIRHDLRECIICSDPKALLGSDEINLQLEFDEILANASQFSPEDKKKLSIFLIAFGRWNSILKNSEFNINEDLLIVSGPIGYQAACILTMIEIFRKQGQPLKLDEVSVRYHQKLCSNLEKQISYKQWRDMISFAFNRWLSKKILEKVSKGVYQTSVDFESILNL